jgi:uncharacterized protein YgiM (DUF1202 family)
MGPRKFAVVAVALTCATVALCGCGKWLSKRSAAAKHGGLFAVTAEKTAFYRYGPQQAHGPDRELTKDTVVTMIRHSFAYSKVRLANGERGFVANDDLARASDSLIAQNNAEEDNENVRPLPPPPAVQLPIADPSPEFEPTPIPDPLMP